MIILILAVLFGIALGAVAAILRVAYLVEHRDHRDEDHA